MALTATAIELSQTGTVAAPAKSKTTKSKKAGEKLTTLQKKEDEALKQAAQAGYDAEIFSAAGSAYLQGGRQKMMEIVTEGMGSFITGMTRVVGKSRITEGYDAWDNVQTAVPEDLDLWGA